MFFLLSIYSSFILISAMGILARSFCSRILFISICIWLSFFVVYWSRSKEKNFSGILLHQTRPRIWAFWSRPRIRSPSPINQWGIPYSGGGGQPATCNKLCDSLRRLSDHLVLRRFSSLKESTARHRLRFFLRLIFRVRVSLWQISTPTFDLNRLCYCW